MATIIHKQRGAAGIYMALLLIPIFGAIFLALEGTRYIQKKNRLADAAEAAALAVTMANREDQNYEEQLAKKYVQAYVRDIKNFNQLEVDSKKDKDVISTAGGDVEKQYTQYKVTAKTTHNSWFSSSLIPSFNEKQTVANQAVARNYPEIPGDRYMDIVFVADFSTSMQGAKITSLRNAIWQISNEALVASKTTHSNRKDSEIKNRIGFVPYSMRTQEKENPRREQLQCASQLRYRNPSDLDRELPQYEAIDWSFWASKEVRSVKNCIQYGYWGELRRPWWVTNGGGKCTQKQQGEARVIKSVLSLSSKEVVDNYHKGYLTISHYPDPFIFIDLKETVLDIFNNKENTSFFNAQGYSLFDQGICGGNFWTIPLSDEIMDLSDIYNMSPDGWTSVYQGIIRGAQVLNEGRPKTTGLTEKDDYDNRLKMIIILSDGEEAPFKSTFSKLVSAGMCDEIRNNFKSNNFYMGVIGIDENRKFQASEQPAFKDCVGEVNIMDVSEVDDFKETIKEMIKKGAQTNGITKLHYRYTN